MGAHSTSDDPTRYRSEEEVRRWAEKDPVKRFETYLQGRGLLDAAGVEAIDAELGEEISLAVNEVEKAARPPRQSLFDDVYAELPWHLREQREELLALPEAPSH
jgi:pyruvate dehydrogenase E1 component alpha subunit/2-oxoisovalerate dehydrogenase E1 component alpha subunit